MWRHPNRVIYRLPHVYRLLHAARLHLLPLISVRLPAKNKTHYWVVLLSWGKEMTLHDKGSACSLATKRQSYLFSHFPWHPQCAVSLNDRIPLMLMKQPDLLHLSNCLHTPETFTSPLSCPSCDGKSTKNFLPEKNIRNSKMSLNLGRVVQLFM